MFEKQLVAIKANYKLLREKLSDPNLIKDPHNYKKTIHEFNRLEEIHSHSQEIKKTETKVSDYKKMLKEEKDQDMVSYIKEELTTEEASLDKQREKLKILMLPRSLEDNRNVVMEIRAGTGGEEASLFSADLFRMYSFFCEKKKWKLETLSSSSSGLKGFKEIIFSITGKSVFESLKYETGVHRVQRIPRTETNGRIHTSTVTVAVLPEAEEKDIEILEKDLKIDTYRASGAGGQHVNTTDSAIRITHLPTKVVATCQDERSQSKNRNKAMVILRARLYEQQQKQFKENQDQQRKSQIGTGERSEKIRTYNYPQSRISDHRIQLTLYRLESFMEGNIEEVIEKLKEKENKEKILAFNS
ncbi:peptide chain release factor 1-like [Ylistrum balloti]|uniref:peptide chain release factor 1-like n=1 Tax=Ylistrum balloti TaxID=509963 RepID=UPI002905B3BB|nr:peptide chain release factor 1-like [Ylistrum balloti]